MSSGAGELILLIVLANRTTSEVTRSESLTDGGHRDESFQCKIRYIQQQDLHLETFTVREALEFSALLRRSAIISKDGKLAYVHAVIKLLDME